MFYMKWLFALLTLSAGSGNANTQDILDQYIQTGLENNQDLLQRKLEIDLSTLSQQQAAGAFLPRVNFQSTYTLANGGRTLQFPVGDLLNPVYQTLNQLTDGNNFPTDLENVDEQFMPDRFHDTRLRIIQPLFNTDLYFMKKAASEQVNVVEARKRAYENELVKEIKVAYYSYLGILELIEILNENAGVLDELVGFNQKRHRADQVTLDEVYRAQYEREQLNADLATAREKLATAKAYFNVLLNRNADAVIRVEPLPDSMPIDPAKIVHGLPTALEKRNELRQLAHARKAQEYRIDQAQGSYFPQIQMVADIGYQGFGYEFSSEQDYWLMNFSLSWNLFNGFARNHQLQKAKIDRQILEHQDTQLKNQIALEITRAEKAYIAAHQRLNARHAALKSATQNFSITRSRYREQQALLVEYLDAQSAERTAALEKVIAHYELLSAAAKLECTLAADLQEAYLN